MRSCSAILLAAGKSQRLGFDKILTLLNGKPVLKYALTSLIESPLVQEIIIVTRQDIIGRVQDLAESLNSLKPITVVVGGAERQDSVYKGLKSVTTNSTLILIHDAARPLLSVSLIEKALTAVTITGAAVVARRATDTLKKVNALGEIQETVDRSSIWLMETPQVFEKNLIINAYEKIIHAGKAVTDDASTVELAGGKVVVVESDALNLKITRSEDWKILELWFKRGSMEEVRKEIHQLSNDMSPLVGYLPLLEKYGGSDTKFKEYLTNCLQSVKAAQATLRTLQIKFLELCGKN